MISRCRIVFVVAGWSALAFSQTAPSEAEVRQKILGTWKLVQAEYTMKDGSKRPFPEYGPNAAGYLMYHADGHMCAVLMNRDLPKWKDESKPTIEEKAARLDGTFGYCGKYEVDAAKQQIVHLPDVATDPGYVATRQVRPYTFEAGKLVLSDVEKTVPDVVRWKIVWQKAE